MVARGFVVALVDVDFRNLSVMKIEQMFAGKLYQKTQVPVKSRNLREDIWESIKEEVIKELKNERNLHLTETKRTAGTQSKTR